MIKKVKVNLGSNSYDILIKDKSLSDVGKYHCNIFGKKTAFIITDKNVEKYFLKKTEKSFARFSINYKSVVLSNGEMNKSFKTLENTINKLLKLNISRDSILYALGGGVIGDLTGFIASIILRGISWVQLPTTLLAQVDSSVGGKTAINSIYGKNLVGTFYQPKLVLIDSTTLKTLPDRELLSGYAEVLKYSLINDKDFLFWLEKNGQDIISRKSKATNYAIERCCINKAAIVTKDEKETNQRALLNLGHTFAHALELEAGYNNLKHGEAVSIGIILALKLSSFLGYIDSNDVKKIEIHLKDIGLPINAKEALPKIKWSSQKIINKIKKDKKTEKGIVNFILCKKIGQAFISNKVKLDDAKIVIQQSLETKI